MARALVITGPGLYAQADSLAEGSLHPDILSDSIHDALGNPGCCNWLAGVQRQLQVWLHDISIRRWPFAQNG